MTANMVKGPYSVELWSLSVESQTLFIISLANIYMYELFQSSVRDFFTTRELSTIPQ